MITLVVFVIKKIKLKSQSIHPKSIMHIQNDKDVRIKHTNKNPTF